MRNKEVKLDRMPARITCEENDDGEVECHIFEGDDVKDFETNSPRKSKPPGKSKSFFD